MSFSVSTNEAVIYSYRLNESEWAEIKKRKDLKLPCCNENAVCVDRKGLRYFDHAKDSQCKLKHNSQINHIKNKQVVIESLLQSGWDVQTEFTVGDEHYAEIYATKNSSKLIIVMEYDKEIEKTKYKVRTQKDIKETTATLLEKHNVKVLWLLEFQLKHSDEQLQQIVKTYNKHATVFALKCKGTQLSVFGLNQTIIRNNFRILDKMGDLKLKVFTEEFFIKKRVIRRIVKPDFYKVYYEFVEIKCPSCSIKTTGLTYISVFCEFDDKQEPRNMLVGKFWYTKAHIEQAQAVVNQDLETRNRTNRLLYHKYYDEYEGCVVTKLRQFCTKCQGWFGVIATGLTFKHKYTSKPLTLNAEINHKDIAKDLGGRIWMLLDIE